MKVCFVGEHGVGKTSIARRFVHNTFDNKYAPTIGTQIMKKEMTLTHPRKKTATRVDMIIWDIMGAKGFRELLNEAYFYGANGIIAVCDATRKDTLKELRYWVDGVIKVAGKDPIQILANKAELSDRKVVRESDVARIGRIYKSQHHFCSAKSGEGVEQAFLNIAQAHLAKVLSKER